MTDTPRHINQILDDINRNLSTKTNSIGRFMEALHERGFGILLFIFALPMALPLPVPPGINLLFSTPLLLLTAQQIIGAHVPWLPSSIKKKSIKPAKIRALIRTARPWLGRLSFFIRPRLAFTTQGIMSRVIGVFGLLFALCICIPIPMTNTVPSFAIMVMALGVLMRDGLAVIGGMIIGSAWITILATIGISGLKALINYIFGIS